MFTEAFDSGLIPMEFVNKTRKEGKLIMGIGHRVKSINNPDKRVTLVKEFVKDNFPKTPLLDYALEVQTLSRIDAMFSKTAVNFWFKLILNFPKGDFCRIFAIAQRAKYVAVHNVIFWPFPFSDHWHKVNGVTLTNFIHGVAPFSYFHIHIFFHARGY